MDLCASHETGEGCRHGFQKILTCSVRMSSESPKYLSWLDLQTTHRPRGYPWNLWCFSFTFCALHIMVWSEEAWYPEVQGSLHELTW